MKRARFALVFGLVCGSGALSAELSGSLQPGFIAQITFDDNVFRVPDGYALDAAFSRNDVIEQLGASVAGKLRVSQQEITFDAQAANNRYRNNGFLDNVSTSGTAGWNWQVASRLSGRLGTSRDRLLSDFAYNRTIAKDVLELDRYFASADYVLGKRWLLKGELTRTEIGRDAPGFAASHVDARGFSLEYETPAGNTVAVDYRHTARAYDAPLLVGETPRSLDFSEQVWRLRVRYAVSERLAFDLWTGYHERDSDDPATGRFADFSGAVWRGTVTWQWSAALRIAASAWRDLGAYQDADSDYFVAKGMSIGPLWTLTPKLSLRASYSRQSQDFLSVTSVPGSQGRDDTARIGNVTLTYALRSSMQLSLGYRSDRRNSNRPELPFGSNAVTLAFNLKTP